MMCNAVLFIEADSRFESLAMQRMARSLAMSPSLAITKCRRLLWGKPTSRTTSVFGYRIGRAAVIAPVITFS
jgi:hypothetical protein